MYDFHIYQLNAGQRIGCMPERLIPFFLPFLYFVFSSHTPEVGGDDDDRWSHHAGPAADVFLSTSLEGVAGIPGAATWRRILVITVAAAIVERRAKSHFASPSCFLTRFL